MSRCSISALLLTTVLYLVTGAGLYYWFQQEPEKHQFKAAKSVPIQMSMFQAPKPAPVVEPKPVVEPPKPPPPKPKKPVKKKVKKKPKKIVKKPKPKVKKVVPVEVVKPEPVPEVEPEKEPPPETEYALLAQEQPEEIKEVVQQPQYTFAQVINAEQDYRDQLYQLISRYAKDTYPRRARRRNWESDVTVSFEIKRDGTITNLRITNPSRRDIFNDAALNIFKKKMQMQFKPFPEEIERSSWSMQVPISYTLR